MMRGIDREFIHSHQALISVAEACWRRENPSYSWHVFDWMAWKLRQKYLVQPIINSPFFSDAGLP